MERGRRQCCRGRGKLQLSDLAPMPEVLAYTRNGGEGGGQPAKGV